MSKIKLTDQQAKEIAEAGARFYLDSYKKKKRNIDAEIEAELKKIKVIKVMCVICGVALLSMWLHIGMMSI